MARYRQLSMAPLHFGAFYRIQGMIYNLYSGFCSSVHSPELPDWFKFPQGEENHHLGSEDDFVLPSQLESLEGKSNRLKADGHRANMRILLRESVEGDGDGDVDEISGILKAKFESPELVVMAIGSCSVKVSKDLIDKILRRFSNDWVPAFGFFKWAGFQSGYEHSPESYDMMVDVLGKCKRFDEMWGLIEEMVQIGGLVSLTTMTKIMRRFAGAGRWDDTIKVFHDLECFGIEKDTAAMNILLDTLCKERSVRRARDAFVELRREIPPNASSFNALIHGWCKARKLEEAEQTMEEMRQFGFNPCVISYTSLIEAYCAEKNFQKVDVIIEEMRTQGCPPNVVTYTIIMHSLGKAKEIQEALNVLEKMKRDGCAPDVSFYNSLIYILSKSGRLQDANDVYEEMLGRGISPNVTTCNTLISVACHHTQEENALKLLQKMEEISCKPDIKTYHPLLKMCCARKWIKILSYLLDHMCRKDVSLDLGTYTLLVQGLCHSGRLEQSCLFFEEMVSKCLIPKEHTYVILLEALERNKMDRAKAKIQQLMMHAQSMK